MLRWMSDGAERRRQAEEARRVALRNAPPLYLRRHGVLAAPEGGDELVAVDVGPAGELWTLWSSPEGNEAARGRSEVPGWATFPDSIPERPIAARVVEFAPQAGQHILIRELSVAHPYVQPMPDGEILIVGARCRWTADGPEQNARLFGADGAPRAAGTLGDGIQHVFATPSGSLWVGYSDEGVFGNYGWGSPGGPAPIGAPGLLRFDADLNVTWRFPEGSAFGHIDDCYALNVVAEDAWACYYSDWPVVRVSDDRTAGWRNSIAGASAIALADGSVAFAGGYRGEHDRVAIGAIADEQIEVRALRRLAMPDGSEIPSDRIIGRGSDLHLVVQNEWYKAEIPASA
jgi:hypothetical protein